ncbi:hypothetical protein CBS63078_10859 [Aspergillus niger]|nr:hypothetical protein CBS63078_10859 [Aspergillus niger]KAI3015939.1 hypothetical protein CBS147347_10992 [Aspergillus niger]KAI3057249.1 hypothetical protein CBS147353_11033 [Aspergillus niger]
MPHRIVRFLQANLRGGSETQLSLLNDQSLRNFDLLLISEPYGFTMKDHWKTHSHHHWRPVFPTKVARTAAEHSRGSMLWINRKITPIRQLNINSNNITAVIIPAERVFLAVSVYIPPGRGRAGHESLEHHLSLIGQTIRGLQQDHRQPLDLLIVGDFDRHDQLWGGDLLATSKRQGEADPILWFMAEFGLQSLLPRGTITFIGSQGRSTVDLTLASPSLAERMLRCQVHPVEHGSDHHAIISTFKINTPVVERGQVRYLFREVNWDEVNSQISHLRSRPPTITDSEELEHQLQHLTGEVSQALHQVAPQAKPSPYCKRWWTRELTALRDEYNHARNQCERARRYGYPQPELEKTAKGLRQKYHTKIRDRKKQHWREFLEKAENIWKVAKYREPNERMITAVPGLRTTEKLVEQDAEKAELLLSTFFPPLPDIQPQAGQERHEPRISQTDRGDESQPVEGTGTRWTPNGSVAGDLGCEWRIAKIITLLKAGMDPSLPNSYRPISLLSTLGKALEAVIAERLSDVVDRFGLLPTNHFGARKRRSCEQALNILVEKIHLAWRKNMVLSLVSFDVKGAYNGVAREVLLRRLRERRIPETLVRWIEAFCQNRRATIVVNSHCSEEREITDAGLPQGSPLSPILFLFMNANLVDTPITDREGAVAFVDDYSAWVVGPSAEANTRRLEEEVVNRALTWEHTSGASFEAKKTQFIHFTRCARKRMLPAMPLWVDGAAVPPQEVVKLLGVLLDQGLKFKHHVGEVAKRGVRAALALRRLRAIPPEVARQLFTAAVASKSTTPRPFGRIVCQAIVGCYKTVALQIAEAEAGIEPVLVRLRKRVLKHWVQCHTLPRSHPFWMCRNAVANQRRRHLSPFKLLELLCPEPTPWMEVIEPAEGEWQSLNDRRPQITLEPLHDLGLERRPNQARIWLFTHSVQRNDKVGSGLVIDVHQRTIMSCAGLAGDSANTNVHLASLLAIHDALDRVKSMLPRIGMAPSHIQVVACTSDRASLQALDHPARPQSGQEFRLAIMRLAGKLIDQGLQIQIRWTPKESNFGQLRRASALALQATQDDNLRGAPTQMAPATWRQVCERLDKQAKEEFESANEAGRKRDREPSLSPCNQPFLMLLRPSALPEFKNDSKSEFVSSRQLPARSVDHGHLPKSTAL